MSLYPISAPVACAACLVPMAYDPCPGQGRCSYQGQSFACDRYSCPGCLARVLVVHRGTGRHEAWPRQGRARLTDEPVRDAVRARLDWASQRLKAMTRLAEILAQMTWPDDLARDLWQMARDLELHGQVVVDRDTHTRAAAKIARALWQAMTMPPP